MPTNAFKGRVDPTALELRYRKIGGVWYLAWYPHGQMGSGRPVSRRKAHDTEVTLIEKIVALEKRLLPEIRPVADLNLKRLDPKP